MDDAPEAEWRSIFDTASALILGKADRASLVVYLSDTEGRFDSFAAFIGMLPFRGVSMALVSARVDGYSFDDLRFASPSRAFELDLSAAARLGLPPLSAVFGPLPSTTFATFVEGWDPV